MRLCGSGIFIPILAPRVRSTFPYREGRHFVNMLLELFLLGLDIHARAGAGDRVALHGLIVFRPPREDFARVEAGAG